jgi:hypothetical protein
MGDLELIDLDHDGVPEIVISILRDWRDPITGETGATGLMVLKQDAEGMYAVADFIVTGFAYRLFAVDINHDGKPDLFGIGLGQPNPDGPNRCGMVALLTDSRGAQLQSPTTLPCGAYEAAVGQLETPGELNLVMLESSLSIPSKPFDQRLHIYTLDQQGHATPNSVLMTAAIPVCAGLIDCSGPMLIDVNGDGIKDLMFQNAKIDENLTKSIFYLRSDGGAYSEYARQNLDASAFLVADIDLDGREDIVVVVQDYRIGYSGVATALTNGPAGLELSHLVPVLINDQMTQGTVGIADLDGDGLPDVIMDSYNLGIEVLFQRLQ